MGRGLAGAGIVVAEVPGVADDGAVVVVGGKGSKSASTDRGGDPLSDSARTRQGGDEESRSLIAQDPPPLAWSVSRRTPVSASYTLTVALRPASSPETSSWFLESFHIALLIVRAQAWLAPSMQMAPSRRTPIAAYLRGALVKGVCLMKISSAVVRVMDPGPVWNRDTASGGCSLNLHSSADRWFPAPGFAPKRPIYPLRCHLVAPYRKR